MIYNIHMLLSYVYMSNKEEKKESFPFGHQTITNHLD